MKKALAILVAVMMLATICMTASAGSFAMKIADVTVEEGTTTVDVPVNVTANDGIWGFIIEVTYDNSILTYKNAAAGASFNVLPNEKAADTVKLVFDAKDMSDVTSTDAVAVLTFDVAGAAGAVAAISASIPDAESNINADGDNVDTTVAAGSVSIVAAAAPVTEPSEEPTQPSAQPTEPTEPSEEPTEPSEAPATQPTAAPTTAPTAAPTTNAAVPSTGSMIPAAAVVLASASAAVLCFARKK
ncbi:MAG: hypothetical protein MJ083_00635 [Clostridia bacterium]|nr:hypothetical protein [Clostridia bacterium]